MQLSKNTLSGGAANCTRVEVPRMDVETQAEPSLTVNYLGTVGYLPLYINLLDVRVKSCLYFC